MTSVFVSVAHSCSSPLIISALLRSIGHLASSTFPSSRIRIWKIGFPSWTSALTSVCERIFSMPMAFFLSLQSRLTIVPSFYFLIHTVPRASGPSSQRFSFPSLKRAIPLISSSAGSADRSTLDFLYPASGSPTSWTPLIIGSPLLDNDLIRSSIWTLLFSDQSLAVFF